MPTPTNTETPHASQVLAQIMADRGLTATALAELSRVGDISAVSRDLSLSRSITPRRMRAYLSALNAPDGLRLTRAYIADLLGPHAATAIRGSPGRSDRIAEPSATYGDVITVPAHARRALAALAVAAHDVQVAQWLDASAAILAPRATPETAKKSDKRRKKDYGGFVRAATEALQKKEK